MTGVRNCLVKAAVAIVVPTFVAAWGIFELVKRGAAALFDAMQESDG